MIEYAEVMAAIARIDNFAKCGWLPHAFSDSPAQLNVVYDAYIEYNIAGSQLKVMCKRGCARSCRQHVYSTYTFEIFNVYRQVRALANYAQVFRALLANAQEFQTMYASYVGSGHVEPVGASAAPGVSLRLTCRGISRQLPTDSE